MGAALGLLASLLWGSADYGGGVASRRLNAIWVTFTSQLAALACLLGACAVVWPVAGLDLSAGSILWGAAAGVAGLIALTSFYTALSTGTMGVVAPIASAGVAVPVIASILQGERPSGAQIAGIVIAATGIILASGPELGGEAGAAGRRSVGLAAVAGIGFGFVAFAIAHGAEGNTLVTLTVQRLSSLTVAGIYLWLKLRDQRPAARDLPQLALVGLGDGGANAAYAEATRHSLVSVASVLSSLYPVVTAVLAWRIDGERLKPIQVAGVAISMLGVVLLAAG